MTKSDSYAKSTEFIIAYELGGITEEAIIEGFQELIDTGLAWRLQGSYGRMAAQLISERYCRLPREPEL